MLKSTSFTGAGSGETDQLARQINLEDNEIKKPNYQQNKRQRELMKKEKQQAKKSRKTDRAEPNAKEIEA